MDIIIYKIFSLDIKTTKKTKKREQNRQAVADHRAKKEKDIYDLSQKVNERREYANKLKSDLEKAQQELDHLREVFVEHQRTVCNISNSLTNLCNIQN